MQVEIQNVVDVCVIGAGPAGMKAAVRCAEAGASVTVIDEQPRPGGQIYRSVRENGHPNGDVFGPDYLRGSALVKAFNKAPIKHIAQATLWRIDEDNTVYWSQHGKAQKTVAKQIIIATGAIERSFPFSGWTLPGVMTAGACQIMMKTSGLVPKQAVMVGTGPLLYLLAAQMIDAGAPPKAIVDTQQSDNYVKAISYASNAWKGRKYLIKGLGLLAKLRKAGIKRYTGVTDIEAEGSDSVKRLNFQCGGKSISLETETVLAHIGVIPNVQLTRAMGLDHYWDKLQVCWKPALDENNMSSRQGVYIAGDSGGIGGALVAELQGELVAVNVLSALSIGDSQHQISESATLKKSIQHELTVRPFLDTLYTPPKQALVPSDKTIVCRCEEVTAGQIRQHAVDGANGINQIKTFTRCGMGPCQGRYCGSTVAHIISDKIGQSMEQVGYYRLRNPIKPLKLGELASLTPANKSFMKKYKSEGVNNERDPKTVH
ncbi:NAD(P)/FAD-dependent oxidoreductase [Vibrio natriegens]|uniref:FAD/NAD(P)-dependent oxidoreductase n=1 Tax=Vibrio natriegens TaxID=691 RepID=UPI001FBA0862|nr:NAD(P)/FAD-dependent oxidoreductase [Vibrio natriegens]